MSSKQLPLKRTGVFNRFQTSVYGSYVPTAADAHFDPQLEAGTRVRRLRRDMEPVEKIEIPS